jgi:K+-transporting ATPase ATPase C chain
MWNHLRANLLLVGLSLLLCCVLYPLILWGVGQVAFRNQAQGSLLDADGKPTEDPDKAVGSLLIAQPFNGPEYFHPRPSSANYNAAASGGSNLAASNPALRGRVAQLLGTIARYSKDYQDRHKSEGEQNVQKDIVAWFDQGTKEKRDLFAEWAERYPTMAKDRGAWPTAPVESDIASTFFEMWLAEQWKAGKLDPAKDFDQVPADMVMTSGSGLDPDITLRNAKYQSDGVVSGNVEKVLKPYIDEQVEKQAGKGADEDRKKAIEKAVRDDPQTKKKKEYWEAEVRKVVDELLAQQASRPMGGLAGDEPLVNVLRLNLALKARVEKMHVE